MATDVKVYVAEPPSDRKRARIEAALRLRLPDATLVVNVGPDPIEVSARTAANLSASNVERIRTVLVGLLGEPEPSVTETSLEDAADRLGQILTAAQATRTAAEATRAAVEAILALKQAEAATGPPASGGSPP